MRKRVFILCLAILVLLPCMVSAAPLTGKISQWKEGKLVSLSGATVIIGQNIWLDTSGNNDVVRGGKVIDKTGTDANGNFTLNAPAGNYGMIIWKGHYVPASMDVNVPGNVTGEISYDNYGPGKHMGLGFER